MVEGFYINNRRYLGNKYKLLTFISDVVYNNCKNVNVVADIFSGTGSFCSLFTNKKLITNDILYSNYLCNLAWFGSEEVDINKIKKIIEHINRFNNIEKNYMTDNFSNTYFDKKGCSKIGYAREYIENQFKLKKNKYKRKSFFSHFINICNG